jgi:hypothetical protein
MGKQKSTPEGQTARIEDVRQFVNEALPEIEACLSAVGVILWYESSLPGWK